MPAVLVDDFRRHLMAFVTAGTEALIFTGEKGAPLKRGNWHKSVKWIATVAKVKLPKGFHFHDLRHTGNNLAAAAGASTRELMHRMGHGSMRAALIYQHATSERDKEIADSLSARVEAAQAKEEGLEEPSG
ncbi:tyrosine-type recombinase/integrase [Lentzea tibetensis]|nr:tyrosine-type recombinase/integrase [Lentzea tibetensis]